MINHIPVLTTIAHAVRTICSDTGLRDYQLTLYNAVQDAWCAGNRNVLAVLPTGGGKTRIVSAIVRDHQAPSITIAHRQELVSQISLAFAHNGVRHRIIGPNKLIRMIVQLHMVEVGTSLYDPNARAAVAGVDTLVRRGAELARYLPTVTLWVQDEAHHVLKDNKWGKAAQMLPNAKGLGVTATPSRADGAGLGDHHEGLFYTMVEGPTMRHLINNGHLTEYRVFAPPSDIDLSHVAMSKATGDYNVNQVRDAVGHSSLIATDGKARIVGDIVSHYKRIAMGKQGVTFVPNVEQAIEVARQFNEAGVPAEVVSAKTPDDKRVAIIRDFKNRKLLQLVNVDILGEGVDVPAIECVSMGRPTASYGLYIQQFGRGLRPAKGKTHAIIIDHVGNVARHGLPDARREWSLDRRERNSSPGDVEPIRTCVDHKVNGIVTSQGCFAAYPKYLRECPECGLEVATPTPAERTGPEHVDGDLLELDAETLARMRGDVASVDSPVNAPITQEEINEAAMAQRMTYHKDMKPLYAASALLKFVTKIKDDDDSLRGEHLAQQEAIGALREIMALWAGHHRAAGRDDGEIFRRFYLRYGVDWLSAQALSSEAALSLGSRVALDIGSM